MASTRRIQERNSLLCDKKLEWKFKDITFHGHSQIGNGKYKILPFINYPWIVDKVGEVASTPDQLMYTAMLRVYVCLANVLHLIISPNIHSSHTGKHTIEEFRPGFRHNLKRMKWICVTWKVYLLRSTS